MMLVLFLVN